MARIIDRVFGYALAFAAGFIYFRLTLQNIWVSALFALALCALIWYMARHLGRRKPKPEGVRPKRKLALASRKRAPRCALYGALYMALYLLTGSIIYLPLSLLLLFLAGLGMRKPEEPAQP